MSKKQNSHKKWFYLGMLVIMSIIAALVLFVPGDGKLAVKVMLHQPATYFFIVSFIVGAVLWFLIVEQEINLPSWMDRKDMENPLIRVIAFAVVMLSFIMLVWHYALYKNPELWDPNIKAKVEQYR